MSRLNQSAMDSLALARELGGTPFVDFIMTVQSQQMADRVFPDLKRLKVTPEVARVVDRTFLLGLYEGWSRMSGRTVKL